MVCIIVELIYCKISGSVYKTEINGREIALR
jgi:hypothetical protein